MPILKIGKNKLKDWAVPKEYANRIQKRTINIIDCGYSDISQIDWGYIR